MKNTFLFLLFFTLYQTVFSQIPIPDTSQYRGYFNEVLDVMKVENSDYNIKLYFMDVGYSKATYDPKTRNRMIYLHKEAIENVINDNLVKDKIVDSLKATIKKVIFCQLISHEFIHHFFGDMFIGNKVAINELRCDVFSGSVMYEIIEKISTEESEKVNTFTTLNNYRSKALNWFCPNIEKEERDKRRRSFEFGYIRRELLKQATTQDESQKQKLNQKINKIKKEINSLENEIKTKINEATDLLNIFNISHSKIDGTKYKNFELLKENEKLIKEQFDNSDAENDTIQFFLTLFEKKIEKEDRNKLLKDTLNINNAIQNSDYQSDYIEKCHSTTNNNTPISNFKYSFGEDNFVFEGKIEQKIDNSSMSISFGKDKIEPDLKPVFFQIKEKNTCFPYKIHIPRGDNYYIDKNCNLWLETPNPSSIYSTKIFITKNTSK